MSLGVFGGIIKLIIKSPKPVRAWHKSDKAWKPRHVVALSAILGNWYVRRKLETRGGLCVYNLKSMKNHFSKLVLLSMVGFLVIPQITLAAWWNPFTWRVVNKLSSFKVQRWATTTPEVTNNQSSEVDALKKEIEELKNKQTSLTAQPKPSATPIRLYTPKPTLKPTPAPVQGLKPTPSPTKTWEEIERETFWQWDQEGATGGRWISYYGEKRYYRKEGSQWIRKNSEAEASAPYTPNQSVYSELSKWLQKQNEILDQQYQKILDDWDKMKTEQKPIEEAQSKLWGEIDRKCPSNQLQIGQSAQECSQMLVEYNQFTNELSAISRKYGYGGSTYRPSIPKYLPSATTWRLESDPNGMSGSAWSTSGSRMRYECTGPSCTFYSY